MNDQEISEPKPKHSRGDLKYSTHTNQETMKNTTQNAHQIPLTILREIRRNSKGEIPSGNVTALLNAAKMVSDPRMKQAREALVLYASGGCGNGNS